MNFDLKALYPNESFDLAGLTIPKYGSLTPNEQKQLSEIDEDLSMNFYKCEMVKIILKSRCELAADVDLGDLPIRLIDQAYQFVLNELREWKPQIQEDEEAEKKAPIGLDSISNSDLTIPSESSGIAQPISSESP